MAAEFFRAHPEAMRGEDCDRESSEEEENSDEDQGKPKAKHCKADEVVVVSGSDSPGVELEVLRVKSPATESDLELP